MNKKKLVILLICLVIILGIIATNFNDIPSLFEKNVRLSSDLNFEDCESNDFIECGVDFEMIKRQLPVTFVEKVVYHYSSNTNGRVHAFGYIKGKLKFYIYNPNSKQWFDRTENLNGEDGRLPVGFVPAVGFHHPWPEESNGRVMLFGTVGDEVKLYILNIDEGKWHNRTSNLATNGLPDVELPIVGYYAEDIEKLVVVYGIGVNEVVYKQAQGGKFIEEGPITPEDFYHDADTDEDWKISWEEVRRVWKLRTYHCNSLNLEDGYAPGLGEDYTCGYHDADINDDGRIRWKELVEVINLYGAKGYHPCIGGESGFCVGLPECLSDVDCREGEVCENLECMIPTFPNANVDDLELFEISVLVRDVNGNSLKNVNVRLYNKDNSIFFPINTRYEEFQGKNCNKVFFDENYYVTTNNQGIAKFKITNGNYLIQVGGQINSDSENKEVIYLEKDVFLQNSQQIELKVKRKILINAVVDSINLGYFEFWLTKKDQKPGFPPFYFEWCCDEFTLQTNANPSLLIVKRSEEVLDSYVLIEDISSNNQKIIRYKSDMAELQFMDYDGRNNPKGNGVVRIDLIDFYLDNFDFDFPISHNKKVYVDPQTIGIRYDLFGKNGQSFVLFKEGGKFIEISEGDKKEFKFGGPFSMNLKIASFDYSQQAARNYIWFAVKDYYGNYLESYKTINPSAPKVIIKKYLKVIFNNDLENNYPEVRMDVRNNFYFEDFRDYEVTFSEDFGEFGSINLVDEPLNNLEMDLVNFQSENLDFLVPKELEFLNEDWTVNFQKFYDEMNDLYGVKTSEKIPVRVVVDGAERAWAPIIWPMVAYVHDTRNTLSWFMITHELGHPYTLNSPLNCRSETGCPYDEESKASYSGITAAQGINPVIGSHLKSRYPIIFKYLEEDDVCFDRIEVIQTLMLYLDKRYPDNRPTPILIRNWNTHYNLIYEDLISNGYNHDEAYGALYSIVVGENVGSIFEKFGLATKERISDALNENFQNS